MTPEARPKSTMPLRPDPRRRRTNLQKVLDGRVLDSRIELTLREVLGIARREFHDNIVDLVKRKHLVTELEPEKPVEVRVALLDELVAETSSRRATTRNRIGQELLQKPRFVS